MRYNHIATTILPQEEPHQQSQLYPKTHSRSNKKNLQTHHVFQQIYKKPKIIYLKVLLVIAVVMISFFIINALLRRKIYHHGAKAKYQISTQQMIRRVDVEKIFGHQNFKEGITREQFFQAIRKLDFTDYVKYGGQMRHKTYPSQETKIQKIQNMIKQEVDYLQQKYQIQEYNKKQLPFCIVVPSYKNIETGLYLRNLNSIFMQNYTNYHVVYVDDDSRDDTELHVRKYLLVNDIPDQKISIIVQKSNKRPVFTIYNAIHKHCKLGELAMIIQGDDAILGTNVLKLYNAIYQKEKCAMIYSSYLDVIDNTQVQLGLGRQIAKNHLKKNAIRTMWQMPGRYLLSFYVDVFKSINEKNFQNDKGDFFQFAYDRVLITHLLEISYPRIKLLKEILYEHRRTPDSQAIQYWNQQSRMILSRKPYFPLKFFPYIERNKYKYFFDGPVQQIIQKTDFCAYKAQNDFQIEGISKYMHIQAIKLTEIIHNIRFGGEIAVQLAAYENSKQKKYKRIQKLIAQDKKYYNQKYNIDYYRKNELPFCIVTSSYNNVKSGLYLRNLDSIFMQDYNNYRVIYIDDCSPDKTGEYVQNYLKEKNIPEKNIQLIINKENKKAMYNLYRAIHQECKSGQVVAIIDGDDSFIGRNVLALYNAVYQRDSCAMAYSNFLTIHNNDRTERGFCHDIDEDMFEQNTFRNSWDLPGTHLMTFYSDLFKKIKISDLTYPNGTFYDYAYDRAILTPLLEMAYPRISVIKEITYEYRNDTGINDAPDEWARVSHIILDKKPYAHLQEFPFIKNFSKLYEENQKPKSKAKVEILMHNTDFQSNNEQKELVQKGIETKTNIFNDPQHNLENP